MPPSIRLLCIDDHDFIAAGLAACAAGEPHIEFIGSLGSAEGLSDAIERLRPDVVLLDLDMPGPAPLEAMAESLRQTPRTRFVVLTAHLRDVNITAAMRLGAAGFLSKADAPSAIFDGVRRAAAGEPALSPAVRERVEQLQGEDEDGARPVVTRLDRLSPRELEVLRLIGRGMSRADIARHLVRSLKTIDAHHTAIMRKLDIHDRAELTRYAIGEGLVEP
ncbi:MAG TPA: response regulator transcription factor [Phycisphaerales bacterium]|nr:response regulator transcription factor [Phycisphaerales bacterium]HMP37369.1 response regulator transcription factor [Phycisphaerales bacterium]